MTKYNELTAFINATHRNPSCHRIEDHDMLNWLKATRKKINAGESTEENLLKFRELLTLVDENKRKKQYE